MTDTHKLFNFGQVVSTSGWTDAAKIAREQGSSRFEERMVLVRAYRQLNRAIRVDTAEMSTPMFREFATHFDVAQQIIRGEIALSGGDFDTLYHLAHDEELGR